jgi:hypothetical protein
MALDKQQSPTNDAAITLVDIEELRKILGAEVDIVGDVQLVAYSTVMCPSSPWDRGGIGRPIPPIRLPGNPGGVF